MTTRRELLEKHDNNYAFDVSEVLLADLARVKPLPMVSVVIPYYETGKIFDRCLHFLQRAINQYPGQVEVIVVDDGSSKYPLLDHTNNTLIRTIVFEENQGRTAARNVGLAAARGKIIMFLDSDVLVDESLISNHIKLHLRATEGGKRAICISFFEFTDGKSEKVFKDRLTAKDINVNDFRISCTYRETWIGCDEDKQYIGQDMQLINETGELKTWVGQYKAWMLPNMILGGAFSVQKEEMVAVGGFDSRFKGYGFTETSAVTKMVAERGNVVVPCILGGALHIEDQEINVPQAEKDRIFKKKHDFYFNTFIMEQIQ